VLSTGLIVLWTGRPAPRSDFKMRAKGNFLCTMLEAINSLCWAGLSWVLVALDGQNTAWMLPLAALALAGGLGVLLFAWLQRRRPL
jgi:ABC-2 type transport system permease protein